MTKNIPTGSGLSYQLPSVALLPPGSSVLPDDFPQRLNNIKEASGLSWNVLGDKLGVDPRQIERWRRGVEPSGGAMLALLKLAHYVPNGPELLLRPGLQRRQ